MYAFVRNASCGQNSGALARRQWWGEAPARFGRFRRVNQRLPFNIVVRRKGVPSRGTALGNGSARSKT
jgi:hypothetical protein